MNCERCGCDDTGFNMETHLTTLVTLCTHCVRAIVLEWKAQDTIAKEELKCRVCGDNKYKGGECSACR